jgi:hypothetical protein
MIKPLIVILVGIIIILSSTARADYALGCNDPQEIIKEL